LTRLADECRPDVESPAVPTAGSDPDADRAELFYPGFYTHGPDAEAWVDWPVAWSEARVSVLQKLTPSPLPKRRGKR
jgi:hypothetical protein